MSSTDGRGEAADGERAAGLTPDAVTALTAFATGGIAGFIDAMSDDSDDGSYDDPVEDPEALRRAEEAVSHDRPRPESEGVPIGWDPYDPRDAVAFLPPGIGTGPKSYALVVPESQMARARGILDGVTPEGVTYAWGDGAVPAPAGSGSVFATPGPAASRRSDLSDNERLERLAGGGNGSAIGFAVAIGVVAIVVAMLLALRG